VFREDANLLGGYTLSNGD